MPSESAILNWTMALPAVGGALVFLLPASQIRRARPIALFFFAATVALALIAARWFEWSNITNGEVTGGGPATLQLTSRFVWLKALGARWSVGVDGLSMPLVLLTAITGFLACWASYSVQRGMRAYCALLLWTVAALIGAFVSLDLLFFFIFFELALVPLYFLIGLWGGARKEYTASKFFLFSMAASIGLLVALILIYSRTRGLGSSGGPGLLDLAELAMNATAKARLSGLTGHTAFWLLLGTAGITMAAAPLHTWLSDVVAEAPVPVALLIVAVVTKLGAYLLMRIVWPLFPNAVATYAPALQWAAALAILYAALAALAQRDLRRIVAFGSVAQMGFIWLGLAVAAPIAAAGAAYQLLAHAVAAGMTVLVAGIIMERTGHSDIRRLGGLGGHMPAFSGWAAVGFLAAMGLPGLCSFVAQLLILLGAFSSQAYLPGSLAAAGVVLMGAGYVWTYQRVFMGAPRPEHSNIARLSVTEKGLLAVFGILALLLGIFPNVLLEPLRLWVEAASRT